jgi:hypothetical protein
VKPDRQFAGIRRGESLITGLLGKFDNRERADTSIQVVVQKDFGKGADEFFGDAHGCRDRCSDSRSAMG